MATALSRFPFPQLKSTTNSDVVISLNDKSITTSSYFLEAVANLDFEVTRRLSALEARLDAIIEFINDRPMVHSIQLIDLNSNQLRLMAPITVVIEVYPDEVSAAIPEFNLYASDVTEALALVKLKFEVCSTFVEYTDMGIDKLGSLLQANFAAMNKVIEYTNA